MTEVRACDIELVRAEFYRQYPTDGTDEQRAETRRKAFYRTVKDAQGRGLVASRELDGIQFIWPATPLVAGGSNRHLRKSGQRNTTKGSCRSALTINRSRSVSQS
jgi:hypothetical protein